MASVTVVLSTYNGERFVDQQIRAILAQNWENLCLVIRDDGSADSTWMRVQRWRTDPRVHLLRGRNLGAKHSFLALIAGLADRSDYLALADQDDLWGKGHLSRAVCRLRRIAGPALFCSRSILTDCDLRPVGLTPDWPRPPSFANALVENIVRGGTIVMNRAAVEAIRCGGMPDRAIMHDWWCYLVVAALGTVIHEERPRVLYRQHGANCIGGDWSAFGKAKSRILRQFRHNTCRLLTAQAAEFLDRYGALPGLRTEHKTLAHAFSRIDPGPEWRDSFRRCHRQFWADDALMRMRFCTELFGLRLKRAVARLL